MLMAVLFVNAVVAPALSYRFIQITRELNRLKSQYNFVNGNTQLLQQLVGEVLEYSKKNPAIDPVLQKVGLKPSAPSPAGAAKPTSK